ncbi:MAG: hypothetical protein WCA10_17400 [Terracidiphilus sp.]
MSGTYVGLERMESLSPEDPLTNWFHENTLFVENNELILDQNPVTIRKGVKTNSASDGGFLTYRGRIFSTKGGTYAALRLIDSDYIAFRMGPKECEPYSRITVFPVKIANKKTSINGVVYKSKSISAEQRETWTKALADESVLYNGKHHYMNSGSLPCPVPPEFADPR